MFNTLALWHFHISNFSANDTRERDENPSYWLNDWSDTNYMNIL